MVQVDQSIQLFHRPTSRQTECISVTVLVRVKHSNTAEKAFILGQGNSGFVQPNLPHQYKIQNLYYINYASI